MSKLTDDIQLRVAREATEEVWKIDDLMGVIKQDVEAREACEGSQAKSQLSMSSCAHPTAVTFISIQCVYCQGYTVLPLRLRVSKVKKTYCLRVAVALVV